jgi:hypothetical protein
MAFYYRAIKRGFINDKLYDPRTSRSTVVVEKKFDKCPSWLEPMEAPKTSVASKKKPAKKKAPAKPKAKSAPRASKVQKKKSIKDVKMDVKEDDLEVL